MKNRYGQYFIIMYAIFFQDDAMFGRNLRDGSNPHASGYMVVYKITSATTNYDFRILMICNLAKLCFDWLQR